MTEAEELNQALALVLAAHNLSGDETLTAHLEGAIDRLTELGAIPEEI